MVKNISDNRNNHTHLGNKNLMRVSLDGQTGIPGSKMLLKWHWVQSMNFFLTGTCLPLNSYFVTSMYYDIRLKTHITCYTNVFLQISLSVSVVVCHFSLRCCLLYLQE